MKKMRKTQSGKAGNFKKRERKACSEKAEAKRHEKGSTCE